MCLALRLLLQPSWFQAGPSDPQCFLFILVGNKIDLDGGSKRMVPEKKAREWCASKGDIPYFETSAKEDHNVDTAFLCIARLALEHEHDQDIAKKKLFITKREEKRC
ncbi:Ras-related protein RABG3a [Zea mays]|uniref:Ras-related protein RABG3a n=1 Tax=Zea mays TaxID=4577 RepID=A0A1D6MIB9_MAIZE|nr:Ras-related protein RABG3a [Zea mays]